MIRNEKEGVGMIAVPLFRANPQSANALPANPRSRIRGTETENSCPIDMFLNRNGGKGGGGGGGRGGGRGGKGGACGCRCHGHCTCWKSGHFSIFFFFFWFILCEYFSVESLKKKKRKKKEEEEEEKMEGEGKGRWRCRALALELNSDWMIVAGQIKPAISHCGKPRWFNSIALNVRLKTWKRKGRALNRRHRVSAWSASSFA